MPGQVGPGTTGSGGGGGTVTGSGTTNTIAKFTSGGVVGNSQITDNGTVVNIATLGGGASINIAGSSPAGLQASGTETEIGDWDGTGNGTSLTIDDSTLTITATASSGLILNAGTGLVSQTGSGTSIVTNTAPTITGLTATGTTLLQLPNPSGLPGTNLEGELTGRDDGTLWYGSNANTWSQVNTANTVITVPGGGTGAATFTANGVLYGNTTSALQVTAQGAANSVLIANAGAPSFSQAPIINTSVQLGVVSSATGLLKLANSASSNLTTIQAGNAAAARTYTWPTNFGAAGTALTDAAGDGTLSWAAAGGGTVTVVSSGSLTSTALVTGGGTTTLQTPSATTTLDTSGLLTMPGRFINNVAGAVSAPAVTLTGAPSIAGTTTTDTPLMYFNGGAAPSTWSGVGTYIGVNSLTGFAGNFIDFHADGGASAFKVGVGGDITAGAISIANGNLLGTVSRGGFVMSADGVIQAVNNAQSGLARVTFGPSNASSSAIARDLVSSLAVQSGAGTATFNDASTAGSGTVSNRYILGIAAPTLTATNASVTNTVASTFFIGDAPTDSTNVTSTAKYALNVDAGLVRIGGISSDATHTDSTVCQDTTTHALYAGSGAVGICLGTSSRRYKEGIREETDGLSEVLELQPVRFRFDAHHGDGGVKEHSGFTAEDIAGTKLARLVDFDKEGKPNAYDWSELFPVLVNAIKDLSAQNELLNTRFNTLWNQSHAN